MENRYKSKIFYGEYSLKHWIELLLSGNLLLPEYQRCFVWKKNQIKKLAESLTKNKFIPPVTIARFSDEKNYIIDGQQRLSSILLLYLGICPKDEKFIESKNDTYAYLNDDEEFDGNEVADWQYTVLTKGLDYKSDIEKAKIDILEKIKKEDYSNLTESIISELENTFIGFSYILCEGNDTTNYFCNLFRNLNKLGTPLSSQESRKSLYFLNTDKRNFFENEIFKGYKLRNINVDFVRYASLASQYAKKSNFDELMKNFGGKEEDYYADFINTFVTEEESEVFFKQTNI